MTKNGEKAKRDIDSFLQFPQKGIIEIVYIFLFIIFFILWEYKIKLMFQNPDVIENIEFSLILFLIGLLHLVSSNILSYLYNLQYIIMPFFFVPLASPKKLKLIGCIIILASITIGLI